MFGIANAIALAASAPTIIWPSPPMLMTPPRNAIQMPRPTSNSGVALVSVWAMPLTIAQRTAHQHAIGFPGGCPKHPKQ